MKIRQSRHNKCTQRYYLKYRYFCGIAKFKANLNSKTIRLAITSCKPVTTRTPCLNLTTDLRRPTLL
ncbi:hypothetical protein ElyMa_000708800 [Elysia marginata]|uniref:Uncharacterized protein n=1 Tax=Elysia marginata TaxID=1093978 RepID=A0AAV4GJQ2_9GAST|nr:hypothetical protein ElyMa_000708800 [Elysia marginata]